MARVIEVLPPRPTVGAFRVIAVAAVIAVVAEFRWAIVPLSVVLGEARSIVTSAMTFAKLLP